MLERAHGPQFPKPVAKDLDSPESSLNLTDQPNFADTSMSKAQCGSGVHRSDIGADSHNTAKVSKGGSPGFRKLARWQDCSSSSKSIDTVKDAPGNNLNSSSESSSSSKYIHAGGLRPPRQLPLTHRSLESRGMLSTDPRYRSGMPTEGLLSECGLGRGSAARHLARPVSSGPIIVKRGRHSERSEVINVLKIPIGPLTERRDHKSSDRIERFSLGEEEGLNTSQLKEEPKATEHSPFEVAIEEYKNLELKAPHEVWKKAVWRKVFCCASADEPSPNVTATVAKLLAFSYEKFNNADSSQAALLTFCMQKLTGESIHRLEAPVEGFTGELPLQIALAKEQSRMTLLFLGFLLEKFPEEGQKGMFLCRQSGNACPFFTVLRELLSGLLKILQTGTLNMDLETKQEKMFEHILYFFTGLVLTWRREFAKCEANWEESIYIIRALLKLAKSGSKAFVDEAVIVETEFLNNRV